MDLNQLYNYHIINIFNYLLGTGVLMNTQYIIYHQVSFEMYCND